MIDVKRPVETEWKGYFRAPLDEFCDLAKKGSVAVFLYSAHVLKNGEICHFSNDGKKDRVIKKNGVSAIYISAFITFFYVVVGLIKKVCRSPVLSLLSAIILEVSSAAFTLSSAEFLSFHSKKIMLWQPAAA